MAVGAVSNANYVNSYRNSLKQRQQTGMMLSIGGLTTLVGSSKNNWAGLAVSTVGALSGLVGMIDCHKATKELKELENQQKFNMNI